MSISEASTQISPENESPEHVGHDSVAPFKSEGDHRKHYEASSEPIQSERSPEDIAADSPDGGLWAWLQVASVYFLFFNSWGMVNAFGAFQEYYDSTLGQSPSNISWIGTFQGFLLLLVGAVAGPIYDKGYLRLLIGSGLVLMTLGIFMTSLSTQYYQVFLAQGVTMGLGAGCLVVPSMAVIVQWFDKKRPIALGTVATGGSVGAILFPIIFRRLVYKIGFGWTTRILGFIILATLAFSFSLIRRRTPPSGKARALLDMRALRSPAFWALTGAVFFAFAGVYLPFFYISSWALDTLPAGTVDDDLANYLLSILNAGSLFGRLIPGFMALRLGSLNVMLSFLILTSILAFSWISVSSLATTIVFCIFYGFFSGAVVSLPPTVAAGITPSVDVAGTWLGMFLSISSVGLLVGNPIAGAIITAQGGTTYVGAQCFGGACVACGAACLGALRWMKYKAGNTWTVPT